ncbi:hypothetical protein [Mycolicibacterium fortuitum]|uniref:hypothetical protein n=1 Tax=Mycolicibacterium fortuitum TaxID=1766 RepID=UPI0026128362|nr:hypothetical protein [Mycolicibacterium fortuitum]
MTEAATTTTPNDMPGAQPGATDTSKPTESVTGKPDSADTTAATGDLSAAERAELARLRDVHKDEQKYRREATSNHHDAEAYRNLLKALGVDGKESKEFDAQAAIKDLSSKFESERVARIRSEVARTEGVEPDDFTGRTEEEMRASAKRFKARIEAEVEKRSKAVATAAAPAGEVTSNGKVDGLKQITSRDDLKKMTPKQIVEAREKGQLDDLQSGKTT